MALQDLMALSEAKNVKKVGLSEERIQAQFPIIFLSKSIFKSGYAS